MLLTDDSVRISRVHERVRRMQVKDIRKIMNIIRTQDVSYNDFIPAYGFTTGEFCVSYVIKQSRLRGCGLMRLTHPAEPPGPGAGDDAPLVARAS